MIAGIVLGAAFLLAGGAKLAAGPAWPVQALALGAPRLVIPFVPWIEIVVGALVCVARPVPVLIALAMLGAFTGLLVVRLAQGQHPPCACFGSWSARPLSWRHLVRNAVLIAVGVVALVT
ncbi:unannotated protein [freshwater metagenome]|uniref:Unannotated protein n=1 Tax=freshwater metagenome TaxID=449393 RepID=A0A6J7DQJ6_9ZZZZ|nr:hypothetical protein [Actinomycetota bacterium]